MGLRSFQDSFGAGDIKQYSCGGYFTIAASSNEVDIELFSQRGNSKGVIENVAAGFWFEDEDITHVQVTSASAQTIEVISGAGKVGINKTTTSINGGTLDPSTLSTHYGYHVGTALQTIVTPAANVNGVRVDSITKSYLQSYGTLSVMTKTSAPADYKDITARHLFSWYSNAVDGNLVDKADFPLIIPAGEGLYTVSDIINNGTVLIEYEIL